MYDADVLETLFAEPRLRLPRPGKPSVPRSARARAPHPATAGTLSLLWMGAGHVHAGRRGLGIALMTITGGATLVHTALAVSWPGVQARLATLGWPSLALAALALLDLLLLVVWVAAALDAYREADRADRPGPPPPAVISAASLLLPGWGELLAGRLRTAARRLWWGALQNAALSLVLLAPLIVPAAGGPEARRAHELALLMVAAVAVCLLPVRVALALEAGACASAGPGQPTPGVTRRTRLLVYLLGLTALLAVDRFPAAFYRQAARDIGEDARATGLELTADAVEAWTP